MVGSGLDSGTPPAAPPGGRLFCRGVPCLWQHSRRCLGGDRPYSTSIYFLLRSGERSFLHQIASDEVWHFYVGSSLSSHGISASGAYERLLLGINVEAGERLQRVVAAGAWFGATVNDPDSFRLVGCTVAPGFDFRDLRLGQRQDLQRQFPIAQLTPEPKH